MTRNNVVTGNENFIALMSQDYVETGLSMLKSERSAVKKLSNEKNENKFYAFLTFFKYLLQDAYAEPGQDSRNIAGIDVVIIVEDVQDVAPVFTLAPPVTRLPSGLIPGDKVMRNEGIKSFLPFFIPAVPIT